MSSVIVEQDFPYDILRRGARDQARHSKRVDDALRKQLKEVVSQHDIITSEGNRKVKVRLRYLDHYRFITYRDHVRNVGRDEFDELNPGQTLYKPSTMGGIPTRPGDQPGEEVYEAEYTIEQLTDIMLEELELPNLTDRRKNIVESESLEYTDRRKRSGVVNLVDKKRTLLANLLRRARAPGSTPSVVKDDLRFRTWDITRQRKSNAVCLLMLDRSGSMWEEKIYAVKALYFWVVQFLRRKYNYVEIKFIAHDTEARELTEKQFFTISDSGGTAVSSAYKLCRNMIRHNYPSDDWNIYAFHASDGDTWGDDADCVQLVHDIIQLGATMFSYTEVDIGGKHGPSELYTRLEHASKSIPVVVTRIRQPREIIEALSGFLSAQALSNGK